MEILFVIFSTIVLAGGYVLIRFFLKEISHQRIITRLSDELRKSNEELRRLDEAKSEFISIASHQLRTPLSAMKGYLSSLLEGMFGRMSAGQLEAVHKIYVMNERLIKLIDDLLALSNVEAGTMRYVFKSVDLIELTKDVAEELVPHIEKKKLRLIVTEPNVNFARVLADPDKLRQVVMNVIDNAVRYTDRGGVEVRFYKKAAHGKPYAGMSVEDSGKGMTGEEIQHLFRKFSRSERVRKLYVEGTGLGLYVAKKIVDDHSGRIYAESDGIGKGSRFYIELPIALE